MNKNIMWFVSAYPWKNSPFKCSLVILTKNGQAEAIKLFKEFYKNENLEPEEAVEVPFVKGEVEEVGTA